MVEKREDIEILIALFLRGEAKPEEAVALMEWRSKSDENELLFSSFEKIYHQVNGSLPYKEHSIDTVWNQVVTELKPSVKVVPIWKRFEFYIGAAAIAIIAFLIGAFWQAGQTNVNVVANNGNNESIIEQTLLKATSDVAEFKLKDNSSILLEPGSSVKVHSEFNSKQRILSLQGSGTFDVTHNEGMPFTINVGKLKVIDVGTIFKIRSIGDTVKVLVTEGEVQLKLNDRLLNVSEGDSAFYVISKDLIDRYKTPLSRQDKVFKFNGTKLSEVVVVLSQFYDRKIVIMDDEIANCTVSVTFRNESLANILDIISELLDIKVIRNKEIIGLYGEGCL